MEIIEPKILTYADIISNNLTADTTANWNPATSYTVGATTITVKVPWEDDGITMIMPDGLYELIADSAAGNYPPDHPAEWLYKGATNRFKMFDEYITTQANADGTESTDPGKIVLELNASKMNSVSLFALSATGVIFELYDSSDVLVDSSSFDLVDSSRVISWSTYFMEERPYKTELHNSFSTLLISKLKIIIEDTRTSSFPGLGYCLVGMARDIGQSKYGIKTSILDFSSVNRDDSGEVSQTVGDYAKLMDLDADIEASKHDYTQDLLARLRGRPIVVQGNNEGINFTSFVVLGLLQEFDLVLKNSRRSVFNLRIEGFI